MKFKHYAALIVLSVGLMAYGKVQSKMFNDCEPWHAFDTTPYCQPAHLDTLQND